ncbi:hypothetical protein GCM10023258_31420 [Terrabacter aeriphilus]|uniref:Uncharacterized protein n=1 Tax=Terrabacter aeriphilus TaxID=515662 RepID=A0ABP9JK34_9MICO
MTVPAAPDPREPRGPSDAGAPVDPTLPTTHPVRRTLRFGAGPEWSLSQLGAAAAGMGGVALYLAGLSVAAGGFDAIWWALVLVPLLTLSWAGSAAPLALWALLLLGWFVLTPAGSFSWWSLPAALGAVGAHAAAALAASSPPAGSFTRRTVRRWVRHAAVAAAAAVPVALLAGALSARPLGLVPAAYVLGLGGVAVGLWLLRTSPPTTPG